MIKNTMRVKERNSICGTMIVSLVTLLVMMMTREVESNPIYDTQNLTKIVIGFSLASNSTNSNFKYHTQQAQTAINLFKSRTLNMTFQQQNLSLEVRLYHDNGPDDGYKMTKKNFQTMCNDPEIAIAIFTISTAPTNNAVPIVQQCGKIAIVPAGVNLTYFDIYQQMFQISTPSNNYIDIMLPNYRYAGIKSLALIVGANAFNIDMCNSLTPKKLKPYNLNIKSIINLSILDSSVILTPNETIQLENALQKSWESNAKSLVLCTLDVVTVAALKIIKQKSYSFESILVGPTRPTYDTVDPDLMQYVFVLNDVCNFYHESC
jgi:ABC-type branched-subunit amino acid transport system substrate-binding protein